MCLFIKKRVVVSHSVCALLSSHLRQATCKCSRRPHSLRQKLKKYKLIQPRSHLLRVGESRQRNNYTIKRIPVGRMVSFGETPKVQMRYFWKK